MLFSCPRCETHYRLTDQESRGRVVRIRCRKCGARIIVRGPGQGDGGVSTEGPAFDTPEALQSHWHAMVRGRQQGPLQAETLEALIRCGDVLADNYVWHPSLPQWVTLGTVAQFAPLLQAEAKPAAAPAQPAAPVEPAAPAIAAPAKPAEVGVSPAAQRPAPAPVAAAERPAGSAPAPVAATIAEPRVPAQPAASPTAPGAAPTAAPAPRPGGAGGKGSVDAVMAVLRGAIADDPLLAKSAPPAAAPPAHVEPPKRPAPARPKAERDAGVEAFFAEAQADFAAGQAEDVRLSDIEKDDAGWWGGPPPLVIHAGNEAFAPPLVVPHDELHTHGPGPNRRMRWLFIGLAVAVLAVAGTVLGLVLSRSTPAPGPAAPPRKASVDADPHAARGGAGPSVYLREAVPLGEEEGGTMRTDDEDELELGVIDFRAEARAQAAGASDAGNAPAGADAEGSAFLGRRSDGQPGGTALALTGGDGIAEAAVPLGPGTVGLQTKRTRLEGPKINRLLRGKLTQFLRCRFQVSDEPMEVRLAFKVTRDGVVTDVQVSDTKQATTDPRLPTCLRSVLEAFQFPPLEEEQSFQRLIVL